MKNTPIVLEDVSESENNACLQLDGIINEETKTTKYGMQFCGLKKLLFDDGNVSYKLKQVKSDLKGFVVVMIMFQLVELAAMYTITMSNERMNLDAPVLPDSVLEALPRNKLAGKISEMLLFSYTAWMAVFMSLHQRRFALLRRTFAIESICYVFRIICIWADVLPRSEYTMECAPKAVDSNDIGNRVLLLWGAAGLAIFGGHMCGNYFFSGHTLMSVITYQNLAHYMPANWWIAHKINTLLAVAIPFLILLSHNHYTIDIIGSIIVGSWVTKLYTFIAETKELESADECFGEFWVRVAEALESDKEKIEYGFGGPAELLAFLKFAYTHLIARRFSCCSKSEQNAGSSNQV